MSDDSRRVWSSDGGRVQDDKPRAKKRSTGDGTVRIQRESKGRRGKTVTVVTGLALAPDELAGLAGELKKMCGVGGSAKDGEITIQGDKVELVRGELVARGFTVKG